MNDKEKMLDLMRFWLFGTFLIIVIAATVYAGGALGLGMFIFRELYYWLAVVITGVLCMVWFYAYEWYLNRKE